MLKCTRIKSQLETDFHLKYTSFLYFYILYKTELDLRKSN